MAGMNYALRFLLSGTKAIEVNREISIFSIVKPFYCFLLLPVRISFRMSGISLSLNFFLTLRQI